MTKLQSPRLSPPKTAGSVKVSTAMATRKEVLNLAFMAVSGRGRSCAKWGNLALEEVSCCNRRQ